MSQTEQNNGRVAVIDIGSNSIKLLVAGRGSPMETLHQAIRETRISAGIGTTFVPALQRENMNSGVESVLQLLTEARSYDPGTLHVVATSAVRDAVNGKDFSQLLAEKTGLTLRVLSGEEEARLIAEGIATDPAIRGCRNFSLVDLGGGSLECIRWINGRLEQAVSLRLGAVRIAERHHVDLTGPLSERAREAIEGEVRETIDRSGFAFEAGAPLVGTGGSVTVSRLIMARKRGLNLHSSNPNLSIEALRSLYEEIANLPMEDRLNVPGLPRERADIFPAALLILLTLMDIAESPRILHSFRNLRFGLAAESLGLC